MTPIIKLLRAAEWAQFQETRVFAGSPDDLRDGYIHISTPEQMPGTLAKWFAGEAGVVALTLDADALVPDLKWEESRSGQLFPHLYRPLCFSEVTYSERVHVNLYFQDIIRAYGISDSDVRLLRHQGGPYQGRTPYTLWRDRLDDFVTYQAVQSQANRAKLTAPYWASFVVTPAQETLFVGLYAVTRIGSCPPDEIDPLRMAPVGERNRPPPDRYEQRRVSGGTEWAGRVIVDWGPGTRSWIQRADRQSKPIVEIAKAFQEERFPGYNRFLTNLSLLEGLPKNWIEALRIARGVYLLTCPRTKEQYVGSASGHDGFLGRWLSYVQNGHGGNIGLKSRDLADYQVSILEVVGSMATVEEILALEGLWKLKLQSREMGLNRN